MHVNIYFKSQCIIRYRIVNYLFRKLDYSLYFIIFSNRKGDSGSTEKSH